jgi:hypothetical protein
VPLIFYSGRLSEIGIASTLGVDGCNDYVRNGCNEFGMGLELALFGPVIAAILSLALVIILLTLRSRLAWIVVPVGAVVATAVFVVGAGFESLALGGTFSNAWKYFEIFWTLGL